MGVGAPIAVGVAQIENVGRGGNEDAVLPSRHSVGKREAVGEDRDMLEASVAIAVLQQLDASLGLCMERVVAHLDDEQAALFVERHRHRVDDVGLGGDQLDAKAGGELKRVEGCLGRVRWLGLLAAQRCEQDRRS